MGEGTHIVRPRNVPPHSNTSLSGGDDSLGVSRFSVWGSRIVATPSCEKPHRRHEDVSKRTVGATPGSVAQSVRMHPRPAASPRGMRMASRLWVWRQATAGRHIHRSTCRRQVALRDFISASVVALAEAGWARARKTPVRTLRHSVRRRHQKRGSYKTRSKQNHI
jgi:hypothetical protein